MTPLRQRFIEDMRLRGLAPPHNEVTSIMSPNSPSTYNTSPENLDLEAIRQYQLYLLNERKLSPQSINTFRVGGSVSLHRHSRYAVGKGMFSPRAGGRQAAGRARPRKKWPASSNMSAA